MVNLLANFRDDLMPHPFCPEEELIFDKYGLLALPDLLDQNVVFGVRRIKGAKPTAGFEPRMACLGSAFVMIGCLVSGAILLWVELTPVLLFLPATIGVGLSLPGSNAGVMDVVPEVASTASG